MTDPFEFLITGDIDAAVAAVTRRDEKDRRQLADDLVAHVRRRRDAWWWNNRATALAVTAVGCLSTAAKTAELLGRRSVSLWHADTGPVIQVARERGISWLPELAYRLAERLSRTEPEGDWRFIADLLIAEQAPPPTGDRFVEGWLWGLAWPPDHLRPVRLIDWLRTDPFLDALVPRLFEVDGLGSRMTFDEFMTDEKLVLLRALTHLAEEGRLDRTVLLDGCISRFLRGDRPAALRAFVRLHDLLAPTPAEVHDRCAAYLRLLADSPGAVASMAQKTLRALDKIELEELLHTSRAVLIRPEKGLVRAQLSWLDRLATRQPDRAAEIATVIATALDHPAADLRDRAGTLAARYGHPIAGAAVIFERGDNLPPPSPPLPMPAPITDPDELAEELATLFSTSMTALPLERVLDGLVRLVKVDRARLVKALAPVLRRHQASVGDPSWNPDCPCGIVSAAVAVTGGDAWRGQWTAALTAWHRRREPTPRPNLRAPAPQQLLRARLAEIGTNISQAEQPELLATPTMVSGAIDPTELYERIARLGARDPWQVDLTQALLRLPIGPDEPLAAKAAALGTPAGDQLAAWLRTGGLPNPAYRVVTVHHREHRRYYGHLPQQRTQVEAVPPDGFDDPFGLLTVPVTPIGSYRNESTSSLWTAVLPHHRGLIAAYALPIVASGADQDVRNVTDILPLLAESNGHAGPALDLALAYGLGARHEADRVAALDALLMLAATGDLDTVAVGSHLGTLTAAGSFPLTRTIQPLRDAATAGAPLSTWRLVAATLPALLVAPTPPRGTVDLLTLATETATATGVSIEIPGLADIAARPGTSRLVTEAQRLTRALNDSSPASVASSPG